MINKKKRVVKRSAYLLMCNLIFSVISFSMLVSLTPFITANPTTYDIKSVDLGNVKDSDIVKIRNTLWKAKVNEGVTSFSTTDSSGNVYSASNEQMKTWKEIWQKKDSSAGNPSTSVTPTIGGSSTLSTTLGIKDAPPILEDGEWTSKGELWGPNTGGALDAILSGAQWAVVAYGIVQMVGPMLGLEKGQVDAASYAVMAGAFVGKSFYTLIGEKGALSNWFKGGWFDKNLGAGWTSFGVAVAVALIVYYMTYKEESVELVTFECYPWDAPTGGSHCEKCNKQGILPCSEYQCRSLGQSCQLLNPGTNEEACTWVNRKDVNPPEIKPWEDALLDDYKYTPDNTISPPDRGVKIEYTKSTTKCVKAFTPLTFGINTNEPAKCKVDYTKKDKFDDMDFYFGGSSTFKYNHSQMLSLPGPSSAAADNLTLKNNGEFELYTRCQDANGNTNTANFVFKFCVEKGPDTTPPLIVATNLLNRMPVAYNTSSINLEVYVNEPANCKWSHLDQAYNKMEETMTCASGVLEMNAQMLYKCTTTLTGLKNREENKFYFRCEDKAEDKNVNSESYEFSLIGTQPLVIDSVGPNETIKDSTATVKVTLEAETSAGYKEGEATCYYSDTGNDDSYIMFFETESHKHSQELWLPEGNYKYYIKCIDLGGNTDTKIAEFRVESDTKTPAIVRAYHEESYLKLITDEEAECVYDTISCSYSFDDGLKLTNVDEVEHYTDWNPDVNLYVKCQDEFGNQPLPNACSIIARPFQISYGESN